MILLFYITFGLAALWTATGDELCINNVGQLLYSYENYINASLILDKSDRALLSSWMTESQVKQVNITSHYRLDMARHLEHSFRDKNTNPKWKDCLSLHKREIDKCKSAYLVSETECLKTANSADTREVKAVHQLEKEIRKWRRTYRYLSNKCTNANPDDQDAVSLCLVQNIKRDNYDLVLQRLIILKLEAMESVLVQLNQALSDLEKCLKMNLSEFLNTVNRVMETLNTCYSRTNRE